MSGSVKILIDTSSFGKLVNFQQWDMLLSRGETIVLPTEVVDEIRKYFTDTEQRESFNSWIAENRANGKLETPTIGISPGDVANYDPTRPVSYYFDADGNPTGRGLGDMELR